jgi:hypothetical protein
MHRFNEEQKQTKARYFQGKTVAHEVYSGSKFIELHPTSRAIWAVNSLRQLMVCRGNFSSNQNKVTQKKDNSFLDNVNHQLRFEPVNKTFNVMKACISNSHQLVVKIVKQLDDLMVRDYNNNPHP